MIACLYAPNGNPVKSEKFGFKLRWLERLVAHAAELLCATGAPIVRSFGDYNVMPTELDVYKPERWTNDALFRIEVRDAFRRLVAEGWTDALRTLHPGERIYTFWDYFRNAYARDAGLRIDHLLLSPAVAARLKAAGVDRDVRGWEKASDHAPVWIELADGAAAGQSEMRGYRHGRADKKAKVKANEGALDPCRSPGMLSERQKRANSSHCATAYRTSLTDPLPALQGRSDERAERARKRA